MQAERELNWTMANHCEYFCLLSTNDGYIDLTTLSNGVSFTRERPAGEPPASAEPMKVEPVSGMSETIEATGKDAEVCK